MSLSLLNDSQRKRKKFGQLTSFAKQKMLKPKIKAVVGCGTYLNMHSNIIISHQWKNVIFCKDSSTFLLSPLNLSINFYLCEKSSAWNWNMASVGIKFIEIFHIFVTLLLELDFHNSQMFTMSLLPSNLVIYELNTT